LPFNPADYRQTIRHTQGDVAWYSLPALAKQRGANLARLPYSIRVLLESALRNHDGFKITDADVDRLLAWSPRTLPACRLWWTSPPCAAR
jgi:aconitate hydratase